MPIQKKSGNISYAPRMLRILKKRLFRKTEKIKKSVEESIEFSILGNICLDEVRLSKITTWLRVLHIFIVKGVGLRDEIRTRISKNDFNNWQVSYTKFTNPENCKRQLILATFSLVAYEAKLNKWNTDLILW